ncbi:restriction endonuclease [Streptomyces canus]|uniref:restriction endonuclease n=1 Tax=Streptomyces canus TaxID=58343 RepID=UPI002E30BA34|nr:restriction endonuclease [Streptomyces canus]
MPYDPEGRIDTQLPFDRVTRERVVRAVLAWSDPGAWRPVAADVRACTGHLPDDDGWRLLAEIVLGEADSRLPLRSRNLRRVKNKARMLRAIYERLDRLQDAAPAVETTAVVSP